MSNMARATIALYTSLKCNALVIHTDGQSGISEPPIVENVVARAKSVAPSANDDKPILDSVSCLVPNESAQAYAPLVPIGSTELKSVTTPAPATQPPGKSRLSTLHLC